MNKTYSYYQDKDTFHYRRRLKIVHYLVLSKAAIAMLTNSLSSGLQKTVATLSLTCCYYIDQATKINVCMAVHRCLSIGNPKW